MDKEYINIAFSLYDKDKNYAEKTGTTIVSILENTTSKINIFLLHDDTLNEENKRKFMTLVKKYNQIINFIYIDIPKNEYDFLINLEQFSKGSLFRLKIPDVIDCKKVIYLDSDIICTIDIKILYSENIGDYSIGAVPDYLIGHSVINENEFLKRKNNYINTGVLIFNLEKIRKNYNVYNYCLNFMKNNYNIKYPDQDALNNLFYNDCKYLSSVYNKGSILNAKDGIFHFANISEKPWKYTSRKISLLYWKYFSLTPWYTELEELLYNFKKTIVLDEEIRNLPIISRKIFIKNLCFRLISEFKYIINQKIIKSKEK
ncbi:glycosyltransferase family 8 protein [Megamonas funiformis]|uniref:glycosyltransferase family 8 protein n=1 Tax=Megamonas funiformis TaxID=437897 RepID=UPI0022DFC39B|nr:glycosyltransferase [Megamonas funiformis]